MALYFRMQHSDQLWSVHVRQILFSIFLFSIFSFLFSFSFFFFFLPHHKTQCYTNRKDKHKPREYNQTQKMPGKLKCAEKLIRSRKNTQCTSQDSTAEATEIRKLQHHLRARRKRQQREIVGKAGWGVTK